MVLFNADQFVVESDSLIGVGVINNAGLNISFYGNVCNEIKDII